MAARCLESLQVRTLREAAARAAALRKLDIKEQVRRAVCVIPTTRLYRIWASARERGALMKVLRM